MSIQSLQELEQKLPDTEMVGKYTKPQALVIMSIMTMLYTIAAKNGCDVQRRKLSETIDEYEVPHLIARFYTGEACRIPADKLGFPWNDANEYTKRLYNHWLIFQDDPVGPELESLIHTLWIAKKHLKHLAPRVTAFPCYDLTTSMVLQTIADGGEQFRVELRLW